MTNILGILNVTPDSFSDGGRYLEPEASAAHAMRLLDEGADLVDIGAVSTKPGAAAVSETQELDRLMPALDRILASIPAERLCVDAASPRAAAVALSCGITRLNLGGGLEPYTKLLPHMVALHAAVFVYPLHMSCAGVPPVEGRVRFFQRQIALARVVGFEPDQLVLDPGVGFGLDFHGCKALLERFSEFQTLGHPLLIGVSRKNHLARLMGKTPQEIPPEQRIEMGLKVAGEAVRNGASWIRTHDVAATARYFKKNNL